MYRYIIILCLIASGVPSRGQLVFHSLEEVWKYADAHNITMLISRAEVNKAVYSKRQAVGALLPQVNATGSYTDNIARQTTLIPGDVFGGPAGSYRTLQFGQQYVYAGGITAQMGLLNFQNWYNARIAKQTEEMSRDSLTSTRMNVYRQIATQYYAYVLMQEAYTLSMSATQIADSAFQSAKNKYTEGTLNEASLDVTQINLQRAQMNLANAFYQKIIAQNNIKALLGMTKDDSISISATLEDNINIEQPGNFAEDPAVHSALLRTKVSLSQYRAAKSAFAPTLNILYNYTTQRYDNTFEPFAKATGTTAWFPAQYWSLQASLPIFSGGSRYYNIKKNKVTYQQSLDLYDAAQKQSAISDENLKLNFQKAFAMVKKAKKIMELSFDNYQHISYRYDAGVASLDERLAAFKDYLDYQNQYLNSLSDVLVQIYQVKIRQQSF